MKELKFRPLRKVKDKIVVASYMQWRRAMTADYNKFNLLVDASYRLIDPQDHVRNHKGELLYFFRYNPADVPVFQWNKFMDLERIRAEHKYYGILWNESNHVNYHMDGADCDGVPTFSHWTADYVADYWKDVISVHPLTVETVCKWFGWFLWQLNNSQLEFKVQSKQQ